MGDVGYNFDACGAVVAAQYEEVLFKLHCGFVFPEQPFPLLFPFI